MENEEGVITSRNTGSDNNSVWEMCEGSRWDENKKDKEHDEEKNGRRGREK